MAGSIIFFGSLKNEVKYCTRFLIVFSNGAKND
jgi:hypothetical protein